MILKSTTKEKIFVTAKIDRVFKTIIADDKNHNLLEAILSNVFQKNVKILHLPKTEMPVETTTEKVKTLDLVIELDGKIVNLEVETGIGLETRTKNFTFPISLF